MQTCSRRIHVNPVEDVAVPRVVRKCFPSYLRRKPLTNETILLYTSIASCRCKTPCHITPNQLPTQCNKVEGLLWPQWRYQTSRHASPSQPTHFFRILSPSTYYLGTYLTHLDDVGINAKVMGRMIFFSSLNGWLCLRQVSEFWFVLFYFSFLF